ncbi:MAG: carbohydrate ABC transporter permease [Cellulosilyticaceae bacterium]
MNGLKKFLATFLKYGILIFASLVAIIPILVIFFGAFKTGAEFNTSGPLQLPQNWLYFDNFIKAFKDGKMLLGFMNTFIILAIAIFGTIITGTMTAYVLSRFDFKFKKTVKALFLFGTLIPGVTMQVSTFQIVNSLGLFNTIWSSIILFMGTDIIAIYIFLQFLDNISHSLDESAIMDGASYITVYRKIIMPLLKPSIVTVLIIKGVGIYNDFYTPFLYMPKASLNVISTSLFKFKGPYGSQWQVICAGITIAIIPTMIIFLFLQRYIYSGLTQGAVKE